MEEKELHVEANKDAELLMEVLLVQGILFSFS